MNYFPVGIGRLPVYLLAAIYLPASIVGLILLRDRESIELLFMVFLFAVIYFVSFGFFSKVFQAVAIKASSFFCITNNTWFRVSVFIFALYVVSIGYAVYLSGTIPMVVALKGGSLMDIAQARSQFLAGLEGYESIIRYLVFILGRSIMPLLLVAAFFYNFRAKYLFFAALLILSLLSLEKASPIFIFLPCALYFAISKMWRNAIIVALLMCASIGCMTILAMGGIADLRSSSVARETDQLEVKMMIPPGMPIQERMGRPGREYLPNLIAQEMGHDDIAQQNGHKDMEGDRKTVSGKLYFLLNRIIWIPYMTAYDWLGFHYSVLNGELTLGRSIGFVHLLYNEPKMPLEKMVYVYEFGASPGGQGASNTVFFVDAKLAFGWAGVVGYCLLFTFCAACIFSSGSRVLIASSIVCFLIASVSSLTATLLSGGLFIYVVLGFLLFEGKANLRASGATGGAE